MKILITGVNGFVGKPLSMYLVAHGYKVLGAVRTNNFLNLFNVPFEIKVIGDINNSTDWKNCLVGIDCVIHLANIAHIISEQPNDSIAFTKVNTEGTLNLAYQAVAEGVKRFIFISSIKVNGESTIVGQSFNHNSKPTPVDSYGLSKFNAEIGLRSLANITGLEVVIIRPPLIYGPGVKANFLNMMQWVARGIPLPFGAIQNQRSMLGIDNLINFIELCLTHPDAAGQTFLVSDDCDVSTTELLEEISYAMLRPSRLLPIPQYFIEKFLILFGHRKISEKLCGSLQLDISLAKTLLSWKPPYSFKNQLKKTVLNYLSGH